MKLVVISPEHDDPREGAVLGALFGAGLERYHVRKPHWSAARLEAWLRALPEEWRPRLVLHQHHELTERLGLGGRHWRDLAAAQPEASPTRSITSRSCHDLGALQGALGRYDSVFFGPVFPSLSKPGHGPRGEFPHDDLAKLFAGRSTRERRTTVLALGGITVETAPRARTIGFDGVAVLGAVWQAADPLRAFVGLENSLARHAA